jgi:hypothetical protein
LGFIDQCLAPLTQSASAFVALSVIISPGFFSFIHLVLYENAKSKEE